MSTSAGTTSSASVYTTPAFWERLWRTAGLQSVLCFIVAYIVYGPATADRRIGRRTGSLLRRRSHADF